MLEFQCTPPSDIIYQTARCRFFFFFFTVLYIICYLYSGKLYVKKVQMVYFFKDPASPKWSRGNLADRSRGREFDS